MPATTTTPFSPRLGLAVAAAITGLILAGGVTLASVLGWLGPPAQAAAVSLNAEGASSLTQQAATTIGDTSAAQVVLVPVVPADGSVQQGTALANFSSPSTPASGWARESAQHQENNEHKTQKPIQLARGDNDDD
jgi:hypothetical protein